MMEPQKWVLKWDLPLGGTCDAMHLIQGNCDCEFNFGINYRKHRNHGQAYLCLFKFELSSKMCMEPISLQALNH